MIKPLLGLQKSFVLLSALVAAVVALAVPTQHQTAAAEGGPVTKVIVWGDSMSLAWGAYLEPLLGVPVTRNGVGGDDVQETEVLFNQWYNTTPPAERNVTGHLCWCGHVNANSAHVGTDKDIQSVVPTLQRMAAKVPLGQFMPIGLNNGP
ncbi:MAG: hypothetical protein M3400_10230, partial [Actinomycetota bacterium]|nr:hypothetical protein [Actinomycetota bacterium]